MLDQQCLSPQRCISRAISKYRVVEFPGRATPPRNDQRPQVFHTSLNHQLLSSVSTSHILRRLPRHQQSGTPNHPNPHRSIHDHGPHLPALPPRPSYRDRLGRHPHHCHRSLLRPLLFRCTLLHLQAQACSPPTRAKVCSRATGGCRRGTAVQAAGRTASA
jgi:hypothetical protein